MADQKPWEVFASSQPSPADSSKPWESFGGKTKEPSLIDRVGQGASRAFDSARTALTDDPNKIAQIASDQARTALPQSEAQRKMAEEFAPYVDAANKAQGVVDNTTAWGAAAIKRAGQLASNPGEAVKMLAEQLPNSLPGMAGTYVGAKGGAALGTMVAPGVGTLVGGALGGIAGGFLGGYGLEKGASMQEQVQKEAQARNIDIQDQGAVSKMVAEKLPEFESTAQRKGVGTAGTDAVLNVLTMGAAGLGGRTLAKEARTLADAVKAGTISAADAATDLARLQAANAARNTLKARALRGAGVTGSEMLGEGLSEAAGQKLAYGSVDAGEVIDESLMGLGSGGAMALGSKAFNKAAGVVDQDATTRTLAAVSDAIGSPAQAGEFTTSPGAADPSAPSAQQAEPPEAPDFTTSPGARGPVDGVDFERDFDTSDLGLVDPQEEARAKAASIDFAGDNDTTPAWSTEPGAAANRMASLDFGREFDTGNLSLADQPVRPSAAMGLNPADGAISRTAALAVDSGAFTEVTPISQRQGIGAQRRLAESPIIDVDARVIEDRAQGIATPRRLQGQTDVSNAVPNGRAVSRPDAAVSPDAPGGAGVGLPYQQLGRIGLGVGDAGAAAQPGAGSQQDVAGSTGGRVAGNPALTPKRTLRDVIAERQAAAQSQQPGAISEPSTPQAIQGQPSIQEAADQGGAGQASSGSQAGGVSAPRSASVEANGVSGLRQITPNSPVIGKEGESNPTIVDAAGRQYRVHSQRNNLVIAHPIIDGKPQVSADTTVRFWTNPEATPSGENDRTDPIYQADAVPQAPAAPSGKRPKARQHPPTVRGSGALAEVSRALGGVSPDLLADLSEKVIRNRTSKTGKKTQYTSWDNPAIPGVGPLFRKGGTGDIAEVARVLEESGYLEAGANERDPIGAAQRAQEIIRGELRKGGSTVQVGNADAIDQEMRARLNAEMEAAMDAESDPWDDFSFTPDDLEESGYAALSDDVKAATEKLIAEAGTLGVDTESIIDDMVRRVGSEASHEEYHAATQEALKQAISEAGGNARQADTAGARAGDQDGIVASGQASTARSEGRDGGSDRAVSDQPEDWRERAGRSARERFKADTEQSIANSTPVVSERIEPEVASGWRKLVEARFGRWGMVDSEMDSVNRIILIKGDTLAQFYYRQNDTADRARALSAAEAWAKNDGKSPEPARDDLTLEAQTEEDLRTKTEREDAATKQAAAEKAAEQDRIRREAEARDNRARADATVDDFQLGQSADQQMSGMDDLFGGAQEQSQPAAAPEVSTPAKPTSPESPKGASLEAIFDGLQGRGLKKKAALEAAAAHPLAERITLVDKHILDILGDLDESGALKINC